MSVQQMGRYLAARMAKAKPMTKRAMLKKWPQLTSIGHIDLAIDWIEANTTLSDNPFLFVWDSGEAVWGFKDTYGKVAVNLTWNLRYLQTRFDTFQRVLDHAIQSPVVAMTPKERQTAKAISAQAGGVVAYIQAMAAALPK